jgi:hypothetical protein
VAIIVSITSAEIAPVAAIVAGLAATELVRHLAVIEPPTPSGQT